MMSALATAALASARVAGLADHSAAAWTEIDRPGTCALNDCYARATEEDKCRSSVTITTLMGLSCIVFGSGFATIISLAI